MPTTEEQPYLAGLGNGGKFRKRPSRSHLATPYDRPPTALRIPTATSNGWLSSLVEPAHRLINAGAHRLFSHFFRKRLPPTSPPLSNEAGQAPRDEHKESVSSDSTGAQEACGVNSSSNPSSSSKNGGLTELEQILKQKTFTRSEVDRLTNLLRSRSDEMSIGGGEKRLEENRFEVIPSNSMVLEDMNQGHPNTPRCENGFQNHLISTSVVCKTVIDEDVASPAELAKAFMGSKPSQVTPPMLNLRSQACRENSTAMSNFPFSPKSPITSLIRRDRAAIPANGFSTPRSQGRSAIYNMARTPYSRVQQTSTIKDSGTMLNLYGGHSSSVSSHYEGELNMPSGAQQGALKRRNSVLENEIGSIGPMRRIRQKSKLISQQGLSSPVSSQHPSSSVKMLTENVDTCNPGSSLTLVASKSEETASKILAHLEKLTPKKNSPTKLSPSMLRGNLRSLENIDSSKDFENVHQDNMLDGLVNFSAPDAQQSASQRNEQNDTNCSTKCLSLIDKVAADTGIDDTISVKDIVPTVNANNSSLKYSVVHPPEKKHAFKMSAHEDFLDLDDDIIPNGIASTPSEAREKLGNSVSESKTTVLEPVKADKPPALSEVKSLSGFILNQKPNLGASDGSAVIVQNTSYAFPSSLSMTAQPAAVATQTSFTSGEDIFSIEPTAPQSIISFGDKIDVAKEPAATPLFGIGSKIADKVPQPIFTFSSSPTDSSTVKFGNSSDPKPGSLSSFMTASAGPTHSVPKVFESSGALTEDSLKSEVLSEIPEPCPVSTSTPLAGIAAFGTANNSSLSNGSFSSSPGPFSSSLPSLFSDNPTSQSVISSSTVSATSTSANTAITSSSLPVFTPVSSLQTPPVFKFGSSVPSYSDEPASGASGEEIKEPKVNQYASFGSTSNTLFGVSATPSTMGSSIIGFSAAAPSTANSQSQGSTPFGGSSVPLSLAESSGATVSQSMSVHFGSSGTSPLFVSSGSSALSSVSSLFGASSAPAASTGFGSDSSLHSNTLSSSKDTASGLFGSSWQQPTKSPIFASSLSTTASSTVFSFGASAASSTVFSFGSSAPSIAATNSVPISFGSSSTSVAATNSVTMPFGSSMPSVAVTNSSPNPFGSTTGGSSGSPFSFTAAATGSSNGTSSGPSFSFTSAPPKTSSQPVFGNPNPVFGFGSVPSGNDQMNMEDSMAEDAVQASTPTATTFSQQPFSPAPSSFAFGSTGGNPFQFGGQQNPSTQQASPFQASASLDFNASGNFSLGAGGGDKSNRKIVKVKGKHRRK